MTNPKIQDDGTKCWYNEQGQLHREDGPAIEDYDDFGMVKLNIWCRHGKRHREDGPAYVRTIEYNCLQWIIDGKLHRFDGPASISDGIEEWWVNGKEIDIRPILERFDISPDWKSWTDEEKFLMRLALS